MPGVYGKKTKTVLLPNFFAKSPEPRRSPRLRKVLEEVSVNVRLIDHEQPQLSPRCQVSDKHTSPAHLSVITDDEDEEPIKKPARRRTTKAPSKEEQDDTDKLSKALQSLELSPDAPTETSDTRSSNASFQNAPETPARLASKESVKAVKQHPVKLTPEIQSYVSPLLECKNVSKTVESFSGWVSARSKLLSFEKIGEGSYGQVFRATSIADDGDDKGSSAGEPRPTVIIKLMPLNAAKGRRRQDFTAVDAAATEVRLLAKMQKVPGYVEFRGACVLRGAVPETFCRLWDEYRASGRTVESRDPRARGAYPASQLWLLLEMSDAGSNLEPGRYVGPEATPALAACGKYIGVARVWDVFWQTVVAVAKAEAFCSFEHRDLHLGNICVKDAGVTRPKRGGGAMRRRRQKPSSAFPTDSTGTVVTIIDYTLSRADMGPSEAVAFDFQADEALLSGEGDLQYDVYRWMDEVLGDRGSNTYDPRTNVLWFYHLIVKLLDMMIPLSETAGETAKDGQGEAMLKILQEVKTMLDPTVIEVWVANSAGDLLQHAFAQDWISAEGL